MIFNSRLEAGKRLAERIKEEGIGKNPLAIALSPGGAIVAAAVASLIEIPCLFAKDQKIESLNLKERAVILIDDGEIELEFLEKAIASFRSKEAREIVVLIPVFASDQVEQLKGQADKVIVLEQPKIFFHAKEFYQDFPEITPTEASCATKTINGL